MSEKLPAYEMMIRLNAAFIGADASATRKVPIFVELQLYSRAPMANPLDSGDDVSATVISMAHRCSHTNNSSYLDLRKTQERRGSKAAGGKDETCKREGIGTF